MSPRIPAVSVVLTRGRGTVLLVRRAKAPYAGRWSLPGGRLEPGETVAEGAARELREETGLVVPARASPIATLAVGPYDIQVVALGDHEPAYGEPAPSSDALEARFEVVATLREDDVTPGLLEVLRGMG